MPQSLGQMSHALPQPEPSHRKGPHETAPSRHLGHHRTATVIVPIRKARSNRTSRPDCGRRQLDGKYIRAIIPPKASQSRPFGHRRRRRQLLRKYILFRGICRQAHRSVIQRSHRVVPLYVPQRQCMLPHRIPLRMQCDPRSPNIRFR
jgi:hypothetical protein